MILAKLLLAIAQESSLAKKKKVWMQNCVCVYAIAVYVYPVFNQ